MIICSEASLILITCFNSIIPKKLVHYKKDVFDKDSLDFLTFFLLIL